MMEQYGKAAIVHPTGTGKSYIAFKLIEDNPENPSFKCDHQYLHQTITHPEERIWAEQTPRRCSGPRTLRTMCSVKIDFQI